MEVRLLLRGYICVRDSKSKSTHSLRFATADWRIFVEEVKGGRWIRSKTVLREQRPGSADRGPARGEAQMPGVVLLAQEGPKRAQPVGRAVTARA